MGRALDTGSQRFRPHVRRPNLAEQHVTDPDPSTPKFVSPLPYEAVKEEMILTTRAAWTQQASMPGVSRLDGNAKAPAVGLSVFAKNGSDIPGLLKSFASAQSSMAG